MMMNKIYIKQNGQTYALFTPQGIQVGVLYCGNDGQFMADVKVIGGTTKLLAERWGIK